MSSYYIRIPDREGITFWFAISSVNIRWLTEELELAHEFSTKAEALAILREPEFLEWTCASIAEVVELKVVAVAPAASLTQLAECAE